MCSNIWFRIQGRSVAFCITLHCSGKHSAASAASSAPITSAPGELKFRSFSADNATHGLFSAPLLLHFKKLPAATQSLARSAARHTGLCHAHTYSTDLNRNLTAASIKQLEKEKRRSKEGPAVITSVLFCFRLCVFFCSIAAGCCSSLLVLSGCCSSNCVYTFPP